MLKLQRIFLLATLLLFSSVAFGGSQTTWHVTLDSGPLGPVEFYLDTTLDGDEISGRSRSGALKFLQSLSGKRNIDNGLLAFSATRGEDGKFTGNIQAPSRNGSINLSINGDQLSGSVDGGVFAGTFTGVSAIEVVPLRDYVGVLDDFDAVVASKVFAPVDLEQPGYLAFRKQLGKVAAIAVSCTVGV